MTRARPAAAAPVIRPLTPARWKDLTQLFGPRGACGGCWCMWWRLPRSEYNRRQGAGNREAFRRLVRRGPAPGLLAYLDGQPAAWVAVAPRGTYPGLGRSRVLAPIDERPVWSVVCLFVDRRFRRRGLTVALLQSAADHVRRRGGRILEGYPIDALGQPVPAAFAWTGLASAFRRAGFREVARRSPTRPIMRKVLRARRAVRSTV